MKAYARAKPAHRGAKRRHGREADAGEPPQRGRSPIPRDPMGAQTNTGRAKNEETRGKNPRQAGAREHQRLVRPPAKRRTTSAPLPPLQTQPHMPVRARRRKGARGKGGAPRRRQLKPATQTHNGWADRTQWENLGNLVFFTPREPQRNPWKTCVICGKSNICSFFCNRREISDAITQQRRRIHGEKGKTRPYQARESVGGA